MSQGLSLLSSMVIGILVLTMQYSSAQTIVPVKEPGKLEIPNIELDEPTVKDENEPTVKDGSESEVGNVEEPTVKGEEEQVTQQNETKSEEQPKVTRPKKEVGGGLDIANTTQQSLEPAYKIKITFDGIKAKFVGWLGGTCDYWDIGVYVQGKLIKLEDKASPLPPAVFACTTMRPLKNSEATVEIPAELVESPKDYQPLSIFTAGSSLSNCHPKPLPEDLPEVRKILSDKGSTRPYYEHAKENIQKIQEQISNGCIPKTVSQYGCISGLCGTWHFYYNTSLAEINILEGSPGYGKVVSKDTVGNPSSIQINTCDNYNSPFCLYYTLECPLCPAVRVHK